jgi:hypothetical protein
MLALGIARTPSSWRLALWDEQQAARLHALERPDDLWSLLRELLETHPAVPVVLPSGCGVPVTRAGDLLDQDIAEMTAALPAEEAGRLSALLAEARHRVPRGLCIPGVKLLPTVPLQRKLGREDLGAADALCSAAWILHCLFLSGMAPDAASFLLVHRASATRVILAVRQGQIVDGLGGRARGLHPPEGDPAPSGGRPLLRTRKPLRLKEAELRLPGCCRLAEDEALCKEVLGLAGVHGLQDALLLGDRAPETARLFSNRLRQIPAPAPAAGYEAALGGALIAAGLTGGPTADLVDRLGIREARDRTPDWIEP